jgi:signal transduction histidine kinase/ActR/RegA family two-component response regulator
MRRASIQTHILLIVLMPALLTEFGLVGYFTYKNITAAERDLSERANNAARHLAGTLPYALFSDNRALIKNLLETEQASSRLLYAVVSNRSNQPIAQLGATQGHSFSARSQINLPTTELDTEPDILLDNSQPTSDTALGYVVVGIDLTPIDADKRSMLFNALLLVTMAMGITGILAWRLSKRLSSQLAQVTAAVGRIAHGDLQARAGVPGSTGGEIGTLAAGVNHMAEKLQANQTELHMRIRHATTVIEAKKDEAERANIAKSRFFAAASHDLRQPMHALALTVAALKARSHSAGIQSLVNNIEAATDAMALLFNSLLDISKLDAGVTEVNLSHFPVQTLFDNLHNQLAPMAMDKGLKLRIRPSRAILHSDPLLLYRILVNLVNNAILYTNHGGVLVGCQIHGGENRITVWDTGYGIPEKQQENVFREFVQLHNPERDRNKGLGLGLAIVARLGQLLGHGIGLRSRPGSGSSFSVNVPAGNPMLVRTHLLAEAPGILIEGALVVLVDDEETILQAMAELFDNWKLDLVTARSAAEALQLLQAVQRMPDIILSDYRLPDDSDGLDVIQQIRGHFQVDIPAVVVTGDTAPETIRRITQAGLPVLYKPLRPARLRALLTHLIQQSRTQAVG